MRNRLINKIKKYVCNHPQGSCYDYNPKECTVKHDCIYKGDKTMYSGYYEGKLILEFEDVPVELYENQEQFKKECEEPIQQWLSQFADCKVKLQTEQAVCWEVKNEGN